MKDMLADLNDLLQAHQAGEDTQPAVRGVHAAPRGLLPREPAERRGAARGDGPAHGGHAGDHELDDARAAGPAPGPVRAAAWRTWTCAGRWTSSRRTCSRCSPARAGGGSTTSRARTRSASPRPPQLMNELGDIDQLENLLSRRHPARRAGRGRHRPGPRAPRRRRGPQPRPAGRAGQDARGRRPHRAARRAATSSRRRASARSAATRCRTSSRSWPRTRWASTRSSAPAPATSGPTRPSPTSSATRSTSTSSARSATRSAGRGAARRCGSRPTTSRSSAPSTWSRSSTVLMVDLSLSMPMRDNFLAAKKVAMALHSLISTQFPRDFLGIVGFSEVAREIKPEAAARGVVGLRLRHEHAARLPARPPAAGPPVRHEADHHDHRRRADRPHHRVMASRCFTTRRSRRRSTPRSPR